jgi:hypothetical protein
VAKVDSLILLHLTTALDPKSIPGLLKLLRIRALYTMFYTLSYILSIFGQIMTERNHLCVWSCYTEISLCYIFKKSLA